MTVMMTDDYIIKHDITGPPLSSLTMTLLMLSRFIHDERYTNSNQSTNTLWFRNFSLGMEFHF